MQYRARLNRCGRLARFRLTDAELLEQVAAGRNGSTEPAFRALVERHGSLVLRICRSVLLDPNDAEDAFQETFLVLLRKAALVRNRASLRSWLHGVAFRTAAGIRSDSARRRANERRAAERSVVAIPERGPDDLSQVLHDEIRRLPARNRDPIVLCYLEGRSCEDAAHHLGWPVGTVKSRLSRGRERLRRRLEHRGVEAPALLGLRLPLPRFRSSKRPSRPRSFPRRVQ